MWPSPELPRPSCRSDARHLRSNRRSDQPTAGVLRSADLADTDGRPLGSSARREPERHVGGMRNHAGGLAVDDCAGLGPRRVHDIELGPARGAGFECLARVEGGALGIHASARARGCRASGIGVNAIARIAFTAMSAGSRAAPGVVANRRGRRMGRSGPRPGAGSTPVVGWLAHPDCTLNGEVLSVAGGRVARFFLGLTPGVVDDTLTVEWVPRATRRRSFVRTATRCWLRERRKRRRSRLHRRVMR